MRNLSWLVAVTAFVACKSESDMKAEIARQQEQAHLNAPEKTPETKKIEGTPEPEKKKDEIPEPDPSKPDEVEKARKTAMQLSRHKDVVRFCEMAKIDEKADPQARLGCALAACNLKEADKAKMWAKGIEKALFEQAIKVCTPLGVTL